MNWLGGALIDWVADWLGEDDATGIPGTSPGGVATFALALENGYTVTYRWPTDVIKTRSGKEQRISRNDAAKESYDGSVLLFGDQAVAARNSLARYAASGQAFLLGLPHEGMSMRLASSGTTVYVEDTTASDWMNPGQRVITMWIDPENPEIIEQADGVIQSTTSQTIVLDAAPGVAGAIGAIIMPAVPIYLEPEQAMPRYPTNAERWELRARAARCDFAMTLASLDLGPLTAATGLNSATVTARTEGSAPSFQMVGDSADFGYLLEETGGSVIFHFYPGFSTVEDLYAALLTSTLVAPTGTYGTGTLGGSDEVALTALSGGDTAGPVGTGASVTTYASHPVWDQPLDNESTITDSIHALTEILDYGGIPYSIGSADMADWGRAVQAHGTLGLEFQWLKLFLATVLGGQKAFWLSTHRDDLPFVSKATNTITVEGDVGAWYPSQRQHVEVVESSGTVTRAEITTGVDNGDGTWTLTIGTTLATSSVDRVSWLELCRFAGSDFPVTFDQHGWQIQTTATAVQR
jgi:hypothetical protein